MRGKLEKEGLKLEMLRKKFEETQWEHDAESSIYLEFLNKTASLNSPESRKRSKEVSISEPQLWYGLNIYFPYKVLPYLSKCLLPVRTVFNPS